MDALAYARLVVSAADAHQFDAPRTEQLAREVIRLHELINTPELEDFDKGARLEAAHQVQRWGEAHDRSKSAENWFWLVGYLAGKALRASIDGDREKALHHTISAAGALRNWHRAIQRDSSGTGIGRDEDLKPGGRAECGACTWSGPTSMLIDGEACPECKVVLPR